MKGKLNGWGKCDYGNGDKYGAVLATPPCFCLFVRVAFVAASMSPFLIAAVTSTKHPQLPPRFPLLPIMSPPGTRVTSPTTCGAAVLVC